jgi:hypothetical protein
LRVTGPLPSLVLRAEDMWRKHNHCHRSWQGSQSEFPLLTLKCPLLCSAPSKGAEYRSLVVEMIDLD